MRIHAPGLHFQELWTKAPRKAANVVKTASTTSSSSTVLSLLEENSEVTLRSTPAQVEELRLVCLRAHVRARIEDVATPNETSTQP